MSNTSLSLNAAAAHASPRAADTLQSIACKAREAVREVAMDAMQRAEAELARRGVPPFWAGLAIALLALVPVAVLCVGIAVNTQHGASGAGSAALEGPLGGSTARSAALARSADASPIYRLIDPADLAASQAAEALAQQAKAAAWAKERAERLALMQAPKAADVQPAEVLQASSAHTAQTAARPAAADASSPYRACGGKAVVASSDCLKAVCAEPRFADHPQCAGTRARQASPIEAGMNMN